MSGKLLNTSVNVQTKWNTASEKMFLDCLTKPCSVVVSRISSDGWSDMRGPDVPQEKIIPDKWIIRNVDDGTRLKKTLRFVRDVSSSEQVKAKKVSALSLYTHIEDGLVKEVICKRFKKRKRAALGLKVDFNDPAQVHKQNGLGEDGEVRDLMDRVLHQVTVETMDGVEMRKLVRAFCRDHGFDNSEFSDPLSLLSNRNVVDADSYGYGCVSKRKKPEDKQPVKSGTIVRSMRKATTTPPKAGILYISDNEEQNLKDSESMKPKDDKMPSSLPSPCEKVKEVVEESTVSSGNGTLVDQNDSEKTPEQELPLESQQPINDLTCKRPEVQPEVKVRETQKSSPDLEESILRTLLLDTTESSEPSKSPAHNMPVISDVVSLKHRESPEIVEIKVHSPERRKSTSDVVHNLRLEIAALERLAAEKERERRLLLYFKSCKEELLKRLTPEPSPPPLCKTDIFSSVKRMSESSYRPYPETRHLPTDSINSYKSLMLTSAGQWSMPSSQSSQYESCGAPILQRDFQRSTGATPLWPFYPPIVPSFQNGKDHSVWRRIGQVCPLREKPVTSSLPQCVVCKVVKAAFLCSGCGKEWYCSERCQRQNWKHHSRMCSS